MTTIERIKMPVTAAQRAALRLGRTGAGGSRPSPDLYRSGYLRRGDDAHFRRHMGLSRAREPDPEPQRLHHRQARPAPADHHARRRRHHPRALQPLHASRHDAVPLGQGQQRARSSAPITAGISSTPASCAACPGRTDMPTSSCAIRSTISRRCRASNPIAASSSARSTSDAPPLDDQLGPIKKPIDEWLDRNPGGKVIVCEANRLKFKGNWKLAYDNSGDGYHVIFSHRSLLETENRFKDEDTRRACPTTRARRTAADVHPVHGQRPSLQGQAAEPREAARRAVGDRIAASRHGACRRRSCAPGLASGPKSMLDLAGSEPVNINVFPNLSLLGNHIQVFQPVSFEETDTRSGTAPRSRMSTARSGTTC